MLIVLSVLYLMLTFIQSNRFLCTYVAGGVYWVGSSGLLSLRGILHPTTRQTAFPARAGPLRKQPRERGGAAVCALSAEGTAALSQSAGQSRMPILHVFYPRCPTRLSLMSRYWRHSGRNRDVFELKFFESRIVQSLLRGIRNRLRSFKSRSGSTELMRFSQASST